MGRLGGRICAERGGIEAVMASEVEIDRALAAVAATLNDQRVSEFERERVQELVAESLGGSLALRVDDGGGLHDDAGARVGAVRRTPSGEWISERQNELADRADTAVPSKPPEKSGIGKLFSKLGPGS
jgi:hypothetical protein